ncbi:MAG: proline dehydrogenase family protein [Acidobacteriota bacterium]
MTSLEVASNAVAGSLFFLAKRFVAGRTIDEAIQAVRKLTNLGITATLDVLGENVARSADAQTAVSDYLVALERIHETGLNCHVSLKLTQMGLDISADRCRSNLSRICERAATLNNFVRIDMEGSAYTERTLTLFHDLFREYQNVGVVIQAYLFRSEEDLKRLIDVGARVRLCKGAYKEPPHLAVQKMGAIRENFQRLAACLLQRGNYPAIATHDERLITWTKNFVREHHIAPNRFEFQMLYGVRPKTQRKLAADGFNMRVYVPFGSHWLPYFYRRLRERKENVLFVVRNLLKG